MFADPARLAGPLVAAGLRDGRLKRLQYRPGLLDGFLASTGLDLTPLQEGHADPRER